MLRVVRYFERHDIRATVAWRDAAAATRGPLEAAKVKANVDAWLDMALATMGYEMLDFCPPIGFYFRSPGCFTSRPFDEVA